MKTYMQKTAEVKRDWHVVDVKGEVLGRVATQIAEKLIGKNKPTYTPHIDSGDFVVVLNAKGVVLTRNKAQLKMYYRNTGFPGGSRNVSFLEMMERHPERVIEHAVYNMLPKNKLRDVRMTRLKVYADAEHKHQAQLGTKQQTTEE
jgi:large subunit ribosomal protein L13